VVAGPTATADVAALSAAGARVYATYCSSCHQANGRGSTGAFPPLAGSDIVTGDPAKLIRVVKYGLSGAVQVAGTTYNGQMPAWSSQISDADIAAVLTYVRTSWGNQAGPITASEVNLVSK
jgi:mono/diheme cytochrome c family protein